MSYFGHLGNVIPGSGALFDVFGLFIFAFASWHSWRLFRVAVVIYLSAIGIGVEILCYK
ncbi:MAG: hypothetical protein WCP79_14510 [Bacillota bacterium]